MTREETDSSVLHAQTMRRAEPAQHPRIWGVEALTARQREVAALLARGMSEKEITFDLGLSPHTTHDHVKAIYRALRVRSRSELLVCLLAPPARH